MESKRAQRPAQTTCAAQRGEPFSSKLGLDRALEGKRESERVREYIWVGGRSLVGGGAMCERLSESKKISGRVWASIFCASSHSMC